jgi:hypothetical protein
MRVHPRRLDAQDQWTFPDIYVGRVFYVSTGARFILGGGGEYHRFTRRSQSVVENANVDLGPSIVVGEDDVRRETGR